MVHPVWSLPTFVFGSSGRSHSVLPAKQLVAAVPPSGEPSAWMQTTRFSSFTGIVVKFLTEIDVMPARYNSGIPSPQVWNGNSATHLKGFLCVMTASCTGSPVRGVPISKRLYPIVTSRTYLQKSIEAWIGIES